MASRILKSGSLFSMALDGTQDGARSGEEKEWRKKKKPVLLVSSSTAFAQKNIRNDSFWFLTCGWNTFFKLLMSVVCGLNSVQSKIKTEALTTCINISLTNKQTKSPEQSNRHSSAIKTQTQLTQKLKTVFLIPCARVMTTKPTSQGSLAVRELRGQGSKASLQATESSTKC